MVIKVIKLYYQKWTMLYSLLLQFHSFIFFVIRVSLQLWERISRNGWMDGCRYESNCPLMGPGTIGGLPSVGVFLRDPFFTGTRQMFVSIIIYCFLKSSQIAPKFGCVLRQEILLCRLRIIIVLDLDFRLVRQNF